MNRRGFFKMFGKVAAVGATAKLAPELLVTELPADVPASLPGVPVVQGYQGVQGFTGIHGFTGCSGYTCADFGMYPKSL